MKITDLTTGETVWDTNTSMPVYFYPADMCETCIRELDDLITSGELSEVNERLEDISFNGYTCPTCIQLEKDNN